MFIILLFFIILCYNATKRKNLLEVLLTIKRHIELNKAEMIQKFFSECFDKISWYLS